MVIKTAQNTIGQELLQELKIEAAVTRKYLEMVPFNELEFRPSEKSESLGRLAVHIAEIIEWWSSCVESHELDFLYFEPQEFHSKKELLTYFDYLLENAFLALENAKDEEFEKDWSMRYGEQIFFTLPKKQVARIFCMNHLIHHRAQLGVYFRLLDLEVPATYGPSADNDEVILIRPF